MFQLVYSATGRTEAAQHIIERKEDINISNKSPQSSNKALLLVLDVKTLDKATRNKKKKFKNNKKGKGRRRKQGSLRSK